MNDRLPKIPEGREALRERLVELELLAAIGKLAALWARGMRDPLTSLAVLTAILVRRIDDPDLLAKISRIEIERKFISDIVKDLLELSDTESNRIRSVDLREIVQAAVDLTRPFGRPTVDLTVALGDEPATVRASSLHLERAVASVVQSALEATETGAVTVRVVREATECLVVVRDSGPELSRDQVFQRFEPRFPQRNLRDRIGLGLYGSKIIITGLGGDVRLVSTRTGSTYTVRLPAAQPRRGSTT